MTLLSRIALLVVFVGILTCVFVDKKLATAVLAVGLVLAVLGLIGTRRSD